jgi:hypothetical protein
MITNSASEQYGQNAVKPWVNVYARIGRQYQYVNVALVGAGLNF